jgi:predicted nuclease with RNAse H fold
MATIEWEASSARVLDLVLGVDDRLILDTASSSRVQVLGLDCPLGWPEDFLRFLTAHRDGRPVGPQEVAGKDWRRRLAYRATDRAIVASCGVKPLSVAADRISLTAMRGASLLSQLAERGQPVDRTGTGVVVEVYPAASLKAWELPHQKYKGANLDGRRNLLQALSTAAPWLDLGQHTELCAQSDDALDAVIAALTARAKALNLTSTPSTPDEQDLAAREGWIALPTTPLAALLPS